MEHDDAKALDTNEVAQLLSALSISEERPCEKAKSLEKDGGSARESLKTRGGVGESRKKYIRMAESRKVRAKRSTVFFMHGSRLTCSVGFLLCLYSDQNLHMLNSLCLAPV